MKRKAKWENLPPQKKQRLDKVLLTNYSSLLKKQFDWVGNGLCVHLHRFCRCASFGILLPLRYPKNMEIEFLSEKNISIENFERLKLFQHKFWKDLKKSNKSLLSSVVSEANYLIVPLALSSIAFEIIESCLENTSRPCEQVSENKRVEHIWVNLKDNSIVKYLCTVPETVPEFFATLIGKNHPDYQSLIQTFKGKNVLNLIQTEKIDIQSLQKFKYKEKSFSLNELAFIKHTRSIIYDPSLYSKQPFFPSGTPIVPISNLSTFYLSKKEHNQLFTLLDSIIKVEKLSYAIDFAQKIQYSGPIDILHRAITSSSADHNFNYESLETIGDCVLKFVTSLSLFFSQQELNESQCTDFRSLIVSNKFLAGVANELDLKYFIKTELPAHSKFVPPFYFDNKKALGIEQKVTDSVLADFVEAVIGSFYLGEGLQAAAGFLYRVGFFKNFERVSRVLVEKKMKCWEKEVNWEFKTRIFEFFYGKMFRIEKRKVVFGEFCYQFKDSTLLRKALTHNSVDSKNNYEKLEFLGDAVLDLVVLTNVFHYSDFSPSVLSSLKQLLVCNQHLSSLCIASGLYKHIRSTTLPALTPSEIKSTVNKNLIFCDIFKLNLNKQLGDVVESLIGAVLIDSNRLEVAISLISELFSGPLKYSLTYHHIYIFTQSYFKQPQETLSIKSVKI